MFDKGRDAVEILAEYNGIAKARRAKTSNIAAGLVFAVEGARTNFEVQIDFVKRT